jgi:hypothetical protein
MDNKTFKEQQDKINKLNPDLAKLLERKQQVLLHLKQPEQVLLDSYYNSVLRQFLNELTYNFINQQGTDISNIIRGKILMVQELLTLKDRLEQNVSQGAQ